MASTNESNSAFTRQLPFSMPAEQALLGCILNDPQKITDVEDKISPEDFYLQEHQEIYRALETMFRDSKNIDYVQLVEQLTQMGLYQKAGGSEYLVQLSNCAASSMNIKDYAKIVKNKSILRKVIETSDSISENAFSEPEDVQLLLGSAENDFSKIAQGLENKSFTNIHDAIADFLEIQKDLRTNPDRQRHVQTGYSDIDRTLVGMGKGDLIILGARPGQGKTSLALNIATNVAKSTGKAVCIFSLEMSTEELANRIISSEALIDSNHIRAGTITTEEWHNISEVIPTLQKLKIYIDDTAGQTVSAIKAKLLSHQARLRRQGSDIALVVVDYLGLLQDDRKAENRVNEVADISRALKLMAKTLEVPVLCAAQLNRGVDKSGKGKAEETKPVLSSLRDSGAIEQDADVIMFIYQPNEQQSDPASGNVLSTKQLIIAKNRHGSQGEFTLGWLPAHTKFRSIADESRLSGGS